MSRVGKSADRKRWGLPGQRGGVSGAELPNGCRVSLWDGGVLELAGSHGSRGMNTLNALNGKL
jgi:hypothetical protein